MKGVESPGWLNRPKATVTCDKMCTSTIALHDMYFVLVTVEGARLRHNRHCRLGFLRCIGRSIEGRKLQVLTG